MLLAWRHRLEFLAFQIVVCLIDCLSPRSLRIASKTDAIQSGA